MGLTATLVRSPLTQAPGGCSGLCPWLLSPTSCTPSSSASRLPRTPSQRLSATRSGGHAGQPCSRGAHTLWCSSSPCSVAPSLARLASPLPPWSASRSATPSPTSSPSAASATSCTALACTSPCWSSSSATRSKRCTYADVAVPGSKLQRESECSSFTEYRTRDCPCNH